MAAEQIGRLVRRRHPRTDFPQQGWIRYAASNAYVKTTGFPAIAQLSMEDTRYWQLQHFCMAPERGAKADGASQTPTIPWFVATERMAPEKYPRPLGDDVAGVPWSPAFFQAYDPAVNAWWIPSDSMGGRKWWTADPPQPGWIGSPNLTLYEGITGFAATGLPSSRMAPKPRYWSGDQPQTVPQQFQAWLISDGRMPNEKYTQPLLDQPQFIYTDQYSGVGIPSEWSGRVKSRRPIDANDVGWLTSLLFNPAQESWLIRGDMVAKDRWWTADPPQPGWAFFGTLPPFDVTTSFPWGVPGDTYKSRLYSAGHYPDVSWISPNLSVTVIVEDGVFYYHVVRW